MAILAFSACKPRDAKQQDADAGFQAAAGILNIYFKDAFFFFKSPLKSTRSSQLISKAAESRVFVPPLLVPRALPPPLPLCCVPGGELEPNRSWRWIYIRSGTYWCFVSCRLSTGSIVSINQINLGNQPQLALPFDTSGKIHTWHQLVSLLHFFCFFLVLSSSPLLLYFYS